jgi:integrase
MDKAHLRLVAPANVKQTVAPRRRPNADYRTRQHLTEAEVEKLIEACKGNRHAHRDATMILVAFRHGLRAAELVVLRWDEVDLEGGVLHGGRSLRVVRHVQPNQRAFNSPPTTAKCFN